MRSEWPELWWSILILSVLGLGGEAIAAARGAGLIALACGLVMAWLALGIWRAR
jgi:hypothetical protein